MSRRNIARFRAWRSNCSTGVRRIRRGFWSNRLSSLVQSASSHDKYIEDGNITYFDDLGPFLIAFLPPVVALLKLVGSLMLGISP